MTKTIETLTLQALDNPYNRYRDIEGIMRAMPDRYTQRQTRAALTRLTRKNLAIQVEPGIWRLAE